MRLLKDICIFKRVEKKYRISLSKKDALLSRIGEHLIPDVHGKSTVCSLYLDTPDHLLIRNSITAVSYKEKLRLRSYGIPHEDTKVFLELKKKYKGVVYKRRISMTLAEAEAYLQNGICTEDTQIMREIDYAMRFYRHPQPAMMIACEREAFFVSELPNLRLTFDTAIRYREYGLTTADGLTSSHGADGTKIISDDTALLEIKTDGAMPLWLSHALSELEIYPASFSKYGTAYLQTLAKKGEKHHACNS